MARREARMAEAERQRQRAAMVYMGLEGEAEVKQGRWAGCAIRLDRVSNAARADMRMESLQLRASQKHSCNQKWERSRLWLPRAAK